MPRDPLFRRYPELADRIPRMPLVDAPTAVERVVGPVPRGFTGELWVKRDDLTGAAYGGNKVRKLEFLLADARSKGKRRLITSGALGSHHVLATTVYGRAKEFAVTAVLYPQLVTDHVTEVLLAIHGLGARLRYCPKMVLLPTVVWLSRLLDARDRPYVIPPGGSSPVGALGYVVGGLELADQVEAGDAPVPDAIYVAAGTLGTVAGMAIGLTLGGLKSRVVGIKIVPDFVASARVLENLVSGTLAILADAGVAVPDAADVLARVELRSGYLGAGYGKPTDAGAAASRRFHDAGLHLDPTYTAKTAAGVLDALEGAREGTHLFWHTLSAANPAPPQGVTVATLPGRFRQHFEGREQESGGPASGRGELDR